MKWLYSSFILIGLIIMSLLLCSCGANSSGSASQPSDGDNASISNEASGSNEADIRQAVQGHLLINMRNATEQERLNNGVANYLIRNGFSQSEGFDYDTGLAYIRDDVVEQGASYIVIPVGRKDIRAFAEDIQQVLGFGIITEEDSNVNGWRYSGDIMLVLGYDAINALNGWEHWSSDDLDFSVTGQVKYWVSVKNATNYGGLASWTMNFLNSSGFSFEEGYSYNVGNAYEDSQNQHPLRLEESLIIIKEDREDLMAIAEDMKEILGFDTIVVEDINTKDWLYNGDILIVLGTDSIAATQR